MNDRHDERIEQLLRRHFSEQLDEHAGTARARFERELASGGPRPTMRIVGNEEPAPKERRQSTPWFGSLWAIGVAGGAMAALLTVVSMRHTVAPPVSAPGKTSQGPSVAANATPAVRDVAWNTVDQGIVRFDDGTAARRLQQNRVDTIKWYDQARKAQIEYVVPRQETVYVGYNRH